MVLEDDMTLPSQCDAHLAPRAPSFACYHAQDVCALLRCPVSWEGRGIADGHVHGPGSHTVHADTLMLQLALCQSLLTILTPHP